MITDKELSEFIKETTTRIEIRSHFLMDGVDELGMRISDAPEGECRHFVISASVPRYGRFRSNRFVPINANESDARAYYNEHLLPWVMNIVNSMGKFK
jgi:hypothetical protein